MRASRTLVTLALLSVAATAVATVGVSQPTPASAGTIPSTDVTWCSGTPTYPCVAGLSIDGTPVTSSDLHWSFVATTFELDGATELSFTLQRDGSYALGPDTLDDSVVVDLKTGAGFLPRVVTGKGHDVEVVRSAPAGVNEVVVTGSPVLVSGQCDQSSWPWVCPEYTGSNPDYDAEWDGYFSVDVSDNGQWTDASQRAAFDGMNYFTNVAATDIPPQVVPDGSGNDYLQINLANRHFRSDGTTVVHGHGELRIPNAFLREVYGVPNPASMTTAGLNPTLSGPGAGTLTVTQEAGGDAMLVTYDGVTFSKRVLKVKRGVITPTRPRPVRAVRTTAARGRVVFNAAQPRGAKVTGYAVRCVPVHGTVVRGSGKRSPVVVSGMKARAYACRVRATSKAGPGAWSRGVRMPARP